MPRFSVSWTVAVNGYTLSESVSKDRELWLVLLRAEATYGVRVDGALASIGVFTEDAERRATVTATLDVAAQFIGEAGVALTDTLERCSPLFRPVGPIRFDQAIQYGNHRQRPI